MGMTAFCQHFTLGLSSSCRIYLSLDTGLVDNLIDVIGRNARLGRGRSNVKHLSRKFANLSHGIYSSLVEDIDLVSVRERAAVPRVSILPPYGVSNRLGERSVWRERIDRSQRAGVGKVRERVEVTGSWIL